MGKISQYRLLLRYRLRSCSTTCLSMRSKIWQNNNVLCLNQTEYSKTVINISLTSVRRCPCETVRNCVFHPCLGDGSGGCNLCRQYWPLRSVGHVFYGVHWFRDGTFFGGFLFQQSPVVQRLFLSQSTKNFDKPRYRATCFTKYRAMINEASR